MLSRGRGALRFLVRVALRAPLEAVLAVHEGDQLARGAVHTDRRHRLRETLTLFPEEKERQKGKEALFERRKKVRRFRKRNTRGTPLSVENAPRRFRNLALGEDARDESARLPANSTL